MFVHSSLRVALKSEARSMGAIPGMIQDLLCISKLYTSRHFLKRWTEWCYFLNETRKIRLCNVLKRSIRVIRSITRAVWDLKRRVEYYIKRSAECADKRYRAQSGMILDTRCIIFSTNKCRETILFSKKKCSSQLDTSRHFLKQWSEYWVLFLERHAEIPAVWCVWNVRYESSAT